MSKFPPRIAKVERITNETRITVEVDLDGTGRAELATGVPFLDHMLDQLARHGMLDLEEIGESSTHAGQSRKSHSNVYRSVDV